MLIKFEDLHHTHHCVTGEMFFFCCWTSFWSRDVVLNYRGRNSFVQALFVFCGLLIRTRVP